MQAIVDFWHLKAPWSLLHEKCFKCQESTMACISVYFIYNLVCILKLTEASVHRY